MAHEVRCSLEQRCDALTSLLQEKEMEKQKLLYQQARLHDRGAAEMVLQTISASKGEKTLNPELTQVYREHVLMRVCLCRRDGADGGLHAEAGHRYTQRRKLNRPAGDTHTHTHTHNNISRLIQFSLITSVTCTWPKITVIYY